MNVLDLAAEWWDVAAVLARRNGDELYAAYCERTAQVARENAETEDDDGLAGAGGVLVDCGGSDFD